MEFTSKLLQYVVQFSTRKSSETLKPEVIRGLGTLKVLDMYLEGRAKPCREVTKSVTYAMSQVLTRDLLELATSFEDAKISEVLQMWDGLLKMRTRAVRQCAAKILVEVIDLLLIAYSVTNQYQTAKESESLIKTLGISQGSTDKQLTNSVALSTIRKLWSGLLCRNKVYLDINVAQRQQIMAAVGSWALTNSNIFGFQKCLDILLQGVLDDSLLVLGETLNRVVTLTRQLKGDEIHMLHREMKEWKLHLMDVVDAMPQRPEKTAALQILSEAYTLNSNDLQWCINVSVDCFCNCDFSASLAAALACICKCGLTYTEAVLKCVMEAESKDLKLGELNKAYENLGHTIAASYDSEVWPPLMLCIEPKNMVLMLKDTKFRVKVEDICDFISTTCEPDAVPLLARYKMGTYRTEILNALTSLIFDAITPDFDDKEESIRKQDLCEQLNLLFITFDAEQHLACQELLNNDWKSGRVKGSSLHVDDAEIPELLLGWLGPLSPQDELTALIVLRHFKREHNLQLIGKFLRRVPHAPAEHHPYILHLLIDIFHDENMPAIQRMWFSSWERTPLVELLLDKLEQMQAFHDYTTAESLNGISKV